MPFAPPASFMFGLHKAEIAQGLESLQRIGVELSRLIDARQPRPVDKIVRKNRVPERYHLARL
jgi:hypothetical protein